MAACLLVTIVTSCAGLVGGGDNSSFESEFVDPPTTAPVDERGDPAMQDWTVGLNNFVYGVHSGDVVEDRVVVAIGVGVDELTDTPLGVVPVTGIALRDGEILWEVEVDAFDVWLIGEYPGHAVLRLDDVESHPRVDPDRSPADPIIGVAASLDIETGEIVWTSSEGPAPTDAVVMNGGDILLGHSDGSLRVIDPSSGATKTEFPAPPSSTFRVASIVPTEQPQLVELVSLEGVSVLAGVRADDSNLAPEWILDGRSGAALLDEPSIWSTSITDKMLDLWNPDTGDICHLADSACEAATTLCTSGGSPPPYFSGVPLYSWGVCFDVENGRPRWQINGHRVVIVGASDGMVYFVVTPTLDDVPQLIALDSDSGLERWRVDVASDVNYETRIDPRFNSGDRPARFSDDAVLLVGSGSALQMFDATTGDPLWIHADAFSYCCTSISEDEVSSWVNSQTGESTMATFELSSGRILRTGGIPNPGRPLSAFGTDYVLTVGTNISVDWDPFDTGDESVDGKPAWLNDAVPSQPTTAVAGEPVDEDQVDGTVATDSCDSTFPTEGDVLNRVYETVPLGPVEVAGGEYASPDGFGFVMVEEDVTVLADINDDCLVDALVVTSSNGGGSGLFVELHVLVSDGDSLDAVAIHLIGDRVGVDSVSVESDGIRVEVLGRFVDDPVETRLYPLPAAG